MKKAILILLILVQSVVSYSQHFNKEEISFDLRYPQPFGNNIINKAFGHGYLGITDIGTDYTLHNINNFEFGITFNSSLLYLSKTQLSLITFCPKLKFDYKIKSEKVTFIPNIALGYSFWQFFGPSITLYDVNGNAFESEKTRKNINGVSFRGGAKLVFNRNKPLNWYLQLACEFTKIDRQSGYFSNSAYNRDYKLFLPGIGVIWKFPTTEEIPNTSTF